MSSSRLFFAAVSISLLTASAAVAAQGWQGAQVMPKSPQIEIQSDNGSAVSMYDIGWPVTVQRTKGRFLWIQDDGAYSRNQTGGWVYCDDVVKLDEAEDHYSDELRRGETAWLYWMRGNSWEANGEPGIAVIDYQSALKVDPRTTLDDIHLRLGRLYAQSQLHNGRGRYQPEFRSAWENEFNAAKEINSDRPLLYYEWGLALSQACACTQGRSQDSQNPDQKTGSSEPSKASAVKHGEKSRGLDIDEGSATASSVPPQPTKSTPAEQTASQPASEVTAGPNRIGSEAAVEALGKYEEAQKLSPHWWRIPLARAELMLGLCDQESQDGDCQVVKGVKPEFFVQLLSHCKKRVVLADDAKLPLLVMRETSDQSPAANKPSPPGAAALPQYMPSVLATALQNFDEAIRLNPNGASDAYRDRAEILRVMKQLDEAHESAAMACRLGNYRQSGSLRTLAQINFDLAFYQPAADFALRAAELASGDEQQRYLRLWTRCGKRCSGADAQLVANSLKAGYVSYRDVDLEGTPGNANGQKPVHVEPPPGFISRSASATD